MKKIKSIVVLLVVLAMAMSLMVACRPAEEDGDPVGSGGKVTSTTGAGGNDNPGGGNDNPGGGNDNPGGGNDNPGGGNNNPGGGNDNPGGGNDNPGGGGGTTQAPNDFGKEVTVEENPLLKEGKPVNREAAVSYDIDKANFVKNTTLADLKGKTFTLYTGVDYGMFGYYNKSETYVNEWAWFKELKSLYGVTIKYVRCAPGNDVIRPFQAMSAGKDIDLITTHVASFPYICNILEPLDSYINTENFAQSYGLDPQISSLTKWKGHHIVLGPCATNGVLLYNRTFILNSGLPDPYELFKKGQWNWTTFKQYMNGLPATTSQGKKVIGMSTWSQYWYWANTNGKACFEIDGDDPNGNIINNMPSAEVKETYTWLESVCKSSKCVYYNGDGNDWFWNTLPDYYTVMYFGAMGNLDLRSARQSYEDAKKCEYFWVPFPRNEKNNNSVCHTEVYGFGIGLPKKTNKPGNRAAAVKFCELWCNRFTESRFDGMIYKQLYTYDQAVECYKYSRKYGRLGLGSGVGTFSTYAGAGTNGTKFAKSITDPSLSTAACLEKLLNYADQEIANVLKFGVQ